MAEDEVTEDAEEEANPLDDAETLRALYHDEGLTQQQIAEEHGVTASTVSHYMKKHGVETRSRAVADDRLDDPQWLEEQYVAEDRTMQDIAEEVGCSDGTVMRRLRSHGIIEPPSDEGEGDDEEEADGGDLIEADD